MAVDPGWLKTHADEFILYVENQGGITLQIPCQDVWNICSHDREHASHADAYEWSLNNDPRFRDKLKGLLRRYTGDIIPFYQFERNRTVDMKVYKEEEKQTMTEEKKTAGQLAKGAVVSGFKRAAVNQSAEVMLNTFQQLVGNELANQVLEHEMGRELVKGFMAGVYVWAAQNTEMIPSNAKVEEICEIMMSNSSQNIIEPNMAAFMEQIPQMIKQLTQISESMDVEKMMDFSAVAEEREVEEIEERQPATADHFRDQS